MQPTTQNKIIFYGAEWCPDCNVSKKFLDENNIEYSYISLEKHPEAAEIVEKINKGYQSIPTIVFPDGTVMVEPSNAELAKKLEI